MECNVNALCCCVSANTLQLSGRHGAALVRKCRIGAESELNANDPILKAVGKMLLSVSERLIGAANVMGFVVCSSKLYCV